MRNALRPLRRALGNGLDTAGRALGSALLRGMRAVAPTPRPWSSPGGLRVAVVMPHPDDETIGAGGVISLHLAAGDRVCVVCVTNGNASRAGGLTPEAMALTREREFHTAISALGAPESHFLGFPESALQDGNSNDEIIRHISPFLRDLDVIYCPGPVDYHPGHLALAAMLAETLPPGIAVRMTQIQVPLTPLLANLVADTAPVRAQKRAALDAYVSQAATVSEADRLGTLQNTSMRHSACEAFWELEAHAYARVTRHAMGQWGYAPPFRGLRQRDRWIPAALLAGLWARRALRRMAEQTPCG